jgi:hypothetical protein
MQTLLSSEQTRKILGISGPTLYRLVDQGLLSAVVIAKRSRKRILRFRPETVEKFIHDRETHK